MKDHITAQWARENSTQLMSEYDKEELIKILSKIEVAVAKGKNGVDVDNFCSQSALDEIKNRGFEIVFIPAEKIGLVNFQSYYKISWR